MGSIRKIYIGLPESLVGLVLWVTREYRTNPLSHEPGGSDVVVEYHNDKVFGYDWIKFPSKYAKKIWDNDILEIHEDFQDWDEEDQIVEIRKVIRRIYARKYKRDDFETVPFKEIWNSETSKKLPWLLLEEFDDDIWRDFPRGHLPSMPLEGNWEIDPVEGWPWYRLKQR